MEIKNEKFASILNEMNNAVANEKITFVIQPEIRSTRDGFGSVELALRHQVDLVTDLDSGEKSAKVRIIGLDSETTILRKIEIAKEYILNGKAIISEGDKMRMSDNLITCIDGHFGKGLELDEEFKQAMQAEEAKSNFPEDEEQVDSETIHTIQPKEEPAILAIQNEDGSVADLGEIVESKGDTANPYGVSTNE